jgi:N4-(beta-N-acetylglucosaminyl)-L-asparaginase
MAHSYALALHGGAGTISKSALTQTIESEYKTALLEALAKGEAILKNGGSALLAVEQTVVSLENCPLFNAGKGAVFTHNKTHEMDACIMDENGNCGSVMCLEFIRHPISVARKVMEKTPHIVLVGDGALRFALDNGFTKENLLTPESEKAWRKWLKESKYEPRINIENESYKQHHQPSTGSVKCQDHLDQIKDGHW